MLELTVILTTLTIFGAMAAPSVGDYVDQAKLVRAGHDVRTLAVSLVRLFNDVGFERNLPHGWAAYDLLVGEGANPAADGAGTDIWTTPSDDPTVGSLNAQLLSNEAGYTPHAPSGGFGFGWRGAYLQDPVAADPWGGRYAVNVRAMRTARADTVRLSAGPNGTAESPFELDGLPTAGDDIVAVVSSAGLTP